MDNYTSFPQEVLDGYKSIESIEFTNYNRKITEGKFWECLTQENIRINISWTKVQAKLYTIYCACGGLMHLSIVPNSFDKFWLMPFTLGKDDIGAFMELEHPIRNTTLSLKAYLSLAEIIKESIEDYKNIKLSVD